jgi:hypothetical protein
LDHELPWAKAPQPNSKKRPWTDLEPDFNWMNFEGLPPSSRRPAAPKEFGQANEYQMEHVQHWQSNLGPSTDPDFDWNYYPVSEVHPPSTSAGSPAPSSPEPELTDPELDLDHQSLSTDSQVAVDPQAAIYAAKGKAKESRRISGTARDVGNALGNAAQRELLPDGRSLNPGE